MPRDKPKRRRDIEPIRAGVRFNTDLFHHGDSSAIDVVLTMRWTNIVLQDLIDSYGHVFGLSAARSNVLLALFSAKQHTMPAHELADALYNTRGNVTWLIARLAEEGLVSSRPSKTDGRSVLIHLTPKGLRLVQAYAPRHYAALDVATSDLTAEERTTLLRLLDKLRSSAEANREAVLAEMAD
jgi:DNA-binding MarR family transcriptional regulator